jgi:(p)ppGpp synthase/HD superfamily hydrolase
MPSPPVLQPLVRWHVHQRRKGIAQEPYINHLLEVASLVSEATSGSDATVIAALLHDTVEDQEVPVEMIAREFGKQVADIVMQVTDVPNCSSRVHAICTIRRSHRKWLSMRPTGRHR